MAEFFVRQPKTRQTHLVFKIPILPIFFSWKSVYAKNVTIVNWDRCSIRDSPNHQSRRKLRLRNFRQFSLQFSVIVNHIWQSFKLQVHSSGNISAL